MEVRNGLRPYKMDSKLYINWLNYLKENIKVKVFTIDDVQNNKLYNYIIKVLTSSN